MKTIGYIRVSTSKQDLFGGSIETQTERIEKYCELRGLELVGFLKDTSSAKAIHSRPAMIELIERCRGGEVDAFVTCKLDRMFRNVVEGLTTADEFEKIGVDMHFMDMGDGVMGNIQTAMGRMIFTNALTVGEFERRRTGERVREVQAHKRNNGEQHSAKAPYGWRFKGGKRIAHPAEQKALRMIWEHHYMIKMGPTAIAQAMSESSFKTQRGKKIWQPSTIQGILNNPVNKDLFDEWQQQHDANHTAAQQSVATGKEEGISHV